MAVVKMSWIKTPKALETYLTKDRGAETVESSSHGIDGKIAETLENEHARFEDSSKNLGVHVIQSWPAKESDLFPPEKFNEMGLELANRIAPGHLAWVVTHTDRDHIHNHVIVSSVHSDTGKRLQNKKAFLFQIRDANDQIAKENGLSFLEPSMKSKEAKLPESVKTMMAHGKSSWRFDLQQKVDFARASSTSFDEYSATLKLLGVDARVEKKNVSYLYGDRTKAIRGKSLGAKYTNDGLMKAFKENDERFAKEPNLRAQLRGEISEIANGSKAISPTTKDYSKFTKVARSLKRKAVPAILEKGGFLAEEMSKANKKSIFEYCKENKIALTQMKDGRMTLRGCDFIFIEENKWKNTRNHTSGGIIDFVRLHDDTNYLRAIAKINQNPRLLLLEPVMGEYSSPYRSFYFPKEKKAEPNKAMQIAQQFLRDSGRNTRHVGVLTKGSRLFFSGGNKFWLLGDSKESSKEFSKGADGLWKEQVHGKPQKGFKESLGRSNRLVVFCDPFEFIIGTQKGAKLHKAQDSLFVLMNEDSQSRIHEILFANPQIKEVHVVSSNNAHQRKKEGKVMNDLKTKLTPFDIQVKELSLEGLALSRERGHSPSL